MTIRKRVKKLTAVEEALQTTQDRLKAAEIVLEKCGWVMSCSREHNTLIVVFPERIEQEMGMDLLVFCLGEKYFVYPHPMEDNMAVIL